MNHEERVRSRLSPTAAVSMSQAAAISEANKTLRAAELKTYTAVRREMDELGAALGKIVSLAAVSEPGTDMQEIGLIARAALEGHRTMTANESEKFELRR